MTSKPRSADTAAEELRRALDFAGLGTWRHDLVTDEVHLDERAREHFGFDRADISTDEFLTHIHPERRARFRQGVLDAADPAKGVDELVAETCVLPPGQDERWLALNVKITEEDVGAGQRHRVAHGSTRDVTERVRREEELRTSREFLDSIIEQSPHAMWISDDKGTLIRCNQALRDLLHATDEELVGKYNVLHDNVIAEQGHMPLVRRVFEAGESVTFPLTYDTGDVEGLTLADRVKVVLNATISPVVSPDGRIIHAIIQHADISELARKEEELHSSREFLDSIIELSPYAMWISDEHGMLLRCNQALRDLLHLTDDQIVGKYNVFEDRFVIEQGFLPLVQRVYTHAERAQFTLTWDNSDIEGVSPEDVVFVVLIVTISPVVDAHGHVTNAIIQHMDITELVRKENELRASREFLDSIIEQSPHAMWISDDKGTLIRCNQALRDLLQLTDDQIVGKYNIFEDCLVIEQGHIPAVRRVYEAGETARFRLTRYGTIIDGVVRTLDSKGVFVVLDVTVSPVFDSRGQVVNAIIQATNVTEQVRAEAALRDSEHRLADIIEFLPDATMVVDKTGTVIAWNQAMEELTGIPKTDMLGHGDYEYAVPFWGERRPILVDLAMTPVEKTQGLYETLIRTGDTLASEKHFEDNPYVGTRDLWAVAAPLYDTEGNVTGAVETIRDVTERTQVEAALRDSERRLADIIEFLPDPTMVIDADGVVIAWNHAMEELTGIPKADMLGRGDYAYAVPFYGEPRPLLADLVLAPQEEIDAWYPSVTRSGTILATESLLHLPDSTGGKYVWAAATPLYDAQGQVVGAIEAIRDMTERALAEQALRESEGKYRSLFENTLDGCALCQMMYENGEPVDYVYLDVNPAFKRLTGLKDPVGKRVTELVPGIRESNPEMFAAYGRVAAGGPPETFETFIAPLGIWSDAAVHSPDEGRFVVVFQTVNERKEAEIALRESERGLREAEAVGHLGHWTYRFSDGHTYWSDELFRILGHDPGDAVPDPGTLMAFAHPDDAECVAQYQRDLVEKGEAEVECRIVRADGTVRDTFSRGFLSEDAQGCPQTFGVIQDITERKQVERELRRLTAELEDRVAQRTAELQATNAELEAFSYSVSHDLRAPLRHISGYTDLLERRYGAALDEQAHHYMETISNAARSMGALIDDLLKFSRAGRAELQLTTVEMDQLVREAIESLESTYAGRSVTWNVAALPSVQGDLSLLRQVWVNLLGNAVKYTRTRTEAQIAVEADETPDEYEFRVRDNGVGFDMRYADKLFGVFQRLHSDEQFEGTGIGLANVRRIITRMGGRVWAEAVPDEGATFHFALPRRKEQESWST